MLEVKPLNLLSSTNSLRFLFRCFIHFVNYNVNGENKCFPKRQPNNSTEYKKWYAHGDREKKKAVVIGYWLPLCSMLLTTWLIYINNIEIIYPSFYSNKILVPGSKSIDRPTNTHTHTQKNIYTFMKL